MCYSPIAYADSFMLIRNGDGFRRQDDYFRFLFASLLKKMALIERKLKRSRQSRKEKALMSLVKCPECRRLCFSDCQQCVNCSREFNRGELSLKLASENKTFERRCYGIFFVLFLLTLIAVTFEVFQGSTLPLTQPSMAISRVESLDVDHALFHNS
jgi:hypothetical protein